MVNSYTFSYLLKIPTTSTEEYSSNRAPVSCPHNSNKNSRKTRLYSPGYPDVQINRDKHSQ